MCIVFAAVKAAAFSPQKLYPSSPRSCSAISNCRTHSYHPPQVWSARLSSASGRHQKDIVAVLDTYVDVLGHIAKDDTTVRSN